MNKLRHDQQPKMDRLSKAQKREIKRWLQHLPLAMVAARIEKEFALKIGSSTLSKWFRSVSGLERATAAEERVLVDLRIVPTRKGIRVKVVSRPRGLRVFHAGQPVTREKNSFTTPTK